MQLVGVLLTSFSLTDTTQPFSVTVGIIYTIDDSYTRVKATAIETESVYENEETFTKQETSHKTEVTPDNSSAETDTTPKNSAEAEITTDSPAETDVSAEPAVTNNLTN